MQDKPLGKKMAKYAAVGALLGIPLPFIGPVIGAAAGAGLAYYKNNKRMSQGSGGTGTRY